jgi:hypothetical protein
VATPHGKLLAERGAHIIMSIVGLQMDSLAIRKDSDIADSVDRFDLLPGAGPDDACIVQ